MAETLGTKESVTNLLANVQKQTGDLLEFTGTVLGLFRLPPRVQQVDTERQVTADLVTDIETRIGDIHKNVIAVRDAVSEVKREIERL
jgi:hypothetical protein